MQIEQYRANTIGVIAQALKGYVGHKAIISELLQNADDADSEFVSFHFHHDRLEVHNDKHFTEKDWNSISEIASGGKHDEEGKIGTFGTGFISVYHITDQPHIFSAGLHKVIYPLSGEIAVEEYPIGKETIFHFPWRREDSRLSQRIESPVWDEGRIEEFLREVTEFIPEAILFLRSICRIDIYIENQQLVTTVKRKKIEKKIVEGYEREKWQLEFNGKLEDWLYYHANNDRETPGNVRIKDRQVSLAFPMGRTIEGKLYNFLPTQIATGLAFHINGAFFPDNNRRGILDDNGTNEHRTKWNHVVIETVAELFTGVITDIRDHIAEHSQSIKDFYQLWPQKEPTDGYNLAAVRERFIEKAKASAILYSSLEHWERPDHIWAANTTNLYSLAAVHLILLPNEGDLISGFAKKHLGTKTLTLRDMLTQIKNYLRSDTPLGEAHPIINNRERLKALYEEFPQYGHVDFDWIQNQPIFLSEAETLVTASQLWRGEANIRDLFKPDDRPIFADTEFEKQWTEGYVALFKGAELVDWLWEWEQSHPENVFCQNENHLKRVLEVIVQDIKRVDHEKLNHLYIILAEGGDGWYSSEGNIFFAKAPSDYELGLPNLLLVKRTLAENTKTKEVYKAAGIQTLQAPDIVDLIEEMVAEGFDSDLNLVQRLYRYFGKEQLSSDVVERLKGLPIYLTARERWIILSQQPDLSLEPQVKTRGWHEVSDVLKKLQLDNSIHPELEREAKFLSKVGVKPLDELTFNRRLVETYYTSSHLSNEDRLTLLEYLRDSVFEHHGELIPNMRQADLILCHDGIYRPASEVYFASQLLDDVFDRHYPRPHPSYHLEIATNQDEEQRSYHQNKWYRFFSRLGMLEEPSPQDVIDRIQQLIAGQPNSASIEAVGRIFKYLNELSKEKLSSYSDLALVAWLPAQGDNKTWHLPSEIYEKRHEKLIGTEAPILRFFIIKSPLKQMLDIPDRPDGDVVARHLIACMKVGAITDEGGIYRYLGKFWNEVEPQHQQIIRNEESIWDGDKDNPHFWKPDHCFIGKQEQPYFGVFRHYREAEAGDIGVFYRNAGIREEATNEQRLVFLREITAGASLLPETQVCLIENLRLIGANSDSYQDIVTKCRQIRIVPDEGLKLHRANTVVLDDQPSLRDKFSRVDLLFVHKDFYEETVVKFWDAIGVTRLSTAKPKIIEIQDKKPDNTLKQRLIDRIPYLRRIIYHKEGHSELAYDLNSLNVFVCDQLLTSYQILEQESSPEQEDVAFNSETNSLYCIQGAKNIRLARKLLEIMRLHGVVDPATIETVLDRELAEIDLWLDDAGYKSLPREDTGSITNPEIPLAKPSETIEGDEPSDPMSQDIPQAYDDEIVIGDDVEEKYDNEIDSADGEEGWHEYQQHQYAGFGTGWGSSSHAPHYPNNLSELIARFDVEQEFPERPLIEFLDDFDEDEFDFDEDLQIAENDFPDTWEAAFAGESPNTWSGLTARFGSSTPREIFEDLWQLQQELPMPEHRRGVFDTICLIFLENDVTEMHVSQIQSAVWKRRPNIAEGTISSILSRARPCFESLGGGYWVFHAEYIEAGYANLNTARSLYGRWAYSQRRQNHFRTTNHTDSAKHVQGPTRNNSPAKLPRPDEIIPSDELLDIALSSGLLIDLETFLGYIPSDAQERQHDIIRRTAQRTEQEQHYDLSLVLYELLHKRGIKGFEKKIKELQRLVPQTEIIQRISTISVDDPKRWDICLEAWQEYPDSIILRDRIRLDIKQSSDQISAMVNKSIRNDTEKVAQKCIKWLRQVSPLWSAWHQDEKSVLTKILPLAFDWLIRNGFFDPAVALIAQCPPDSRLLRDEKHIDMHSYLYAMEQLADWLSQHGHQKSANVLLAYGLYVAQTSGQKLVDIKEIERKVRSSRVSIDAINDAEQDTSIRNWINLQTLKKMIEQHQ